MPRRHLYLRLLRGSLLLGAAYDLGYALAMVVFPNVPATWLNLPLPGEEFYLWIMATFLTMLAILYVAAARDPRRYSAVIVVAIVGRAAGAMVFGAFALTRPELEGLWVLALADLGFATVHAVSWWPMR